MNLASHAQDNRSVNLSAGLLYPNTLDATLSYEIETKYHNAWEFFANGAAKWKDCPSCGHVCAESFWKDHYWGGGVLYKKQLRRFKNSTLRFRIGPECGAHTGDYFFAVEGGLEYNYVFQNRMQLSVIQKNQVGFFHGDTFRNGIIIGLKIPF